MSELHNFLKDVKINSHCGDIDLYNHIENIKHEAKTWLKNLEKNGYDHSERLEQYLDSLTQKLRQQGGITADESFVLLYAVYLHDIGYENNGCIESSGHQKRSQEYINKDPSKYFFNVFPPYNKNIPRVAEAVGIVCRGHSSDIPLDEIPDQFPDHCFLSKKLNLRKIVAFLRIADEADDPYIRIKFDSSNSIRKKIPLVEIRDNTIIWYWERSGENDVAKFEELLQMKMRLLNTSTQYLRSIGAGEWFIVISPQISHNIPFMPGDVVHSFVGRDSDLKDLHDKIQRDPSSLTGIIGIGGIGKTELARAYAKKYKQFYTDGIFWASLKGSTWNAESSKILAATEPDNRLITFVDDTAAIGSLSKFFLNRKKAILIIDDVIDEKEIIKSGCFVLITSRNQTVLGSAHKNSVFRLSGLNNEGGINLLSIIIGDQRVSKNPDCASQIIKILGGMPLAIEIAAQYLSDIPDLSFSDYIGQIQNRIEELKIDGNEDKNVFASLEISIAQLSTLPDGRDLLVLFEAASICPKSGFTSDFLRQIVKFKIKNKIEVMRLVSKLYDRCLIEFNPISNHYFFHPLLKKIAEQRLNSNNKRKTEIIKNYCMYFSDYCQAHNNDPDVLISEKDGIWQALLLTQQLKRGDAISQKIIENLSKTYWAFIQNQDYILALNYLSDCNLEKIDKIGEIKKFGDFLNPLINNIQELEPYPQIYVLTNRAVVDHKVGENASAISLFKKALDICRQIGDLRIEGIILGNLGLCYAALNKNDDAISHYQEAYEIAQEFNWARESGALLNNLGNLYADLGNKPKALEYYEKRLEVARQAGDLQGEANSLTNLGLLKMEMGELGDGYSNLYDSLELTQQIGDIPGEGYIFGNMGISYSAMGLEDKALVFFQKSYDIAKKTNDIVAQSKALRLMSLTYAGKGNFKRALKSSQRSLLLAKKIGDLRLEAGIHEVLFFIYMKKGDEKTANKHLDVAKKLFSDLKLDHMVTRIDDFKIKLYKEFFDKK